MRKIVVPPGIGDSLWILQKLINQSEKFDFVLSGGQPRRGKQIFDLLPQLSNSCEYANYNIGYNFIKRNNIHHRHKEWNEIKDQQFYLTANEWLEEGNELKDFLPDLSISYTLPWKTEQYREEVKKDIESHKHLIAIYGSSYSTVRAWGFWQEAQWFELISRIHKENQNITYVIIGAEWDVNLSSSLIGLIETNPSIKYLNTVGKPLGYVMELMKELDYGFYFPSGLPILSETLDVKTDCTMFYPPHLEKMMRKWCDPARIEGKQFKECLFCTPLEIFDWVKDTYKLFDKLN